MPDRDEEGRWLPGSSGNPTGRPKGYRRMVDDLYRILAEAPLGDELEAQFEALDVPPSVRATIEMSGDRQEALMRALIYRAMIGNWRAFEEIGSRLDPPPVAPIITAGLNLAGAAPRDAQAAYLGLVRGEEVPDGAENPEDDPDG